jgi:hypothetical protein
MRSEDKDDMPMGATGIDVAFQKQPLVEITI